MIYTYERHIVTNTVGEETRVGYDIDNFGRRDGEGNQLRLCQEICAALPSHRPRLNCYNAIAEISFDHELTPEEKAILDIVVYNHQHNL